MAKSDEKVMALVEKELKRKPDASVDELYEKAKAAQPSVGQLTYRQFNARYPLQVKRKKSQKSPGGNSRRGGNRSRPKASSRPSQRDEVRAAFLSFATDVLAAEDRKELVRVLVTVDTYVDRVIRSG
jgi:hypothetical protein